MKNERFIADLALYGRIIRARGWKAGEAFIVDASRRHKDFRRWAHALAILLRAEELLADLA